MEEEVQLLSSARARDWNSSRHDVESSKNKQYDST